MRDHGTTAPAEARMTESPGEGWHACATQANRCPRCGTPYPTHAGIRDTHVFGASDAVEMDCVCDECGLAFSEIWMWEDTPHSPFSLGYVGTLVKGNTKGEERG